MPAYVDLVPTQRGLEAKVKPLRTTALNAREIMRNSDFYKRKPRADADPVVKALTLDLESMSDNELKVMMIRAGGKPRKKVMTRAELLEATREAVYGVAVVAEADPAPGPEPDDAPRVAVDPPQGKPDHEASAG